MVCTWWANAAALASTALARFSLDNILAAALTAASACQSLTYKHNFCCLDAEMKSKSRIVWRVVVTLPLLSYSCFSTGTWWIWCDCVKYGLKHGKWKPRVVYGVMCRMDLMQDEWRLDEWHKQSVDIAHRGSQSAWWCIKIDASLNVSFASRIMWITCSVFEKSDHKLESLRRLPLSLAASVQICQPCVTPRTRTGTFCAR